MQIKYHGHSCFSVTSNNYVIVLDPYKGVNGFKDINLSANEIICSHSHFDHAYVDEIKITKKDSPFIVKTIKSFHDNMNGQQRGENNITVLNVEGKTIAHLGDLGHLLDEKTINELKNIDVLMIPIGGFYTINSDEALSIINSIDPKYIIPMHYRDGNKGLDVLESIDDFVNKANTIKNKLLLVKGYEESIDI